MLLPLPLAVALLPRALVPDELDLVVALVEPLVAERLSVLTLVPLVLLDLVLDELLILLLVVELLPAVPIAEFWALLLPC